MKLCKSALLCTFFVHLPRNFFFVFQKISLSGNFTCVYQFGVWYCKSNLLVLVQENQSLLLLYWLLHNCFMTK